MRRIRRSRSQGLDCRAGGSSRASSTLVVEVVAPGPRGLPAQQPLCLGGGDRRGISAVERTELDSLALVARRHGLLEWMPPDRVRRGDVEDLVTGQVGLAGANDGVAQVVHV